MSLPLYIPQMCCDIYIYIAYYYFIYQIEAKAH